MGLLCLVSNTEGLAVVLLRIEDNFEDISKNATFLKGSNHFQGMQIFYKPYWDTKKLYILAELGAYFMVIFSRLI